jgi:hypothetical protein
MAGDDGRIPDTVTLCSHHEATARALSRLDHLGDAESDRVSKSIARQCLDCIAVSV